MTYRFFQKRAIIVGLLALFGLVSCGDSSSQSAIDNSSEGCLMEPLADDSGIKVMCYGDSVAVLLHGKDGSDGKDGKDGKDGRDGADGKSCNAVPLQDNSGLKILCGGDSVGVVFNGRDGKDGKDGKDGAGCSIKKIDDSKTRIVCGTDSITFNLGGTSSNVVISIDSLTGVAQKGPFLKGSSVYLYELSDEQSLKQTKGNFITNVKSDDGRFKFTDFDLGCQYAMLLVDGRYKNELTEKATGSAIKLKSLIDVSKSKSANINLLTHLEYERIHYLVTQKNISVDSAKVVAQSEIFKLFHIDAAKFDKSEKLDLYGKTDADAALLAVSVLLQGDRDESDLSVLLTEISDDIKEDGKWDDKKTLAMIADWAQSIDEESIDLMKSNQLFAKYIRQYWSVENGLGICGSKSVFKGTVKNVSNSGSKYYAAKYADTSKTKERFICLENSKWRLATDIEKDTVEWKPKNSKDGTILAGPISGRKYVFDKDTLRYATESEIKDGKGCVSYLKNKSVMLDNQYSYYKCTEEGWTYDFEHLNIGSFEDARDGKTYKTVGIKSQMWMAENLNYDYQIDDVSYGSVCYDDDPSNCDKYGRLYTWAAIMDSANTKCGWKYECSPKYPVQGICPDGWHLPENSEWETLIEAVGGAKDGAIPLKSKEGWSDNDAGVSSNGTDLYGFNAIPVGYQMENASGYTAEDKLVCYWSPTEEGLHYGHIMEFHHYTQNVKVSISLKHWGYSVRCVKD